MAWLLLREWNPAPVGDLEDYDGPPDILLQEWKQVIHAYVPVVAKMPKAQRADLYRLTMRFMTEKSFIGREGVEVTEDMAVIIASQACLLLMGRPTAFYPTLDTVYIYPSKFAVKGLSDGPFVGVSYNKGPISLAWDYAEHGAIHPHDGHNVVIHEFAHQLDQETGLYDGMPVIEDPALYARWREVMSEARAKLTRRHENDEATVLNPYGRINSEEFFAVATESFFEVPGPLKLVYPEVYEELTLYYQIDPVMWGAV